jgi:hypothetical protein
MEVLEREKGDQSMLGTRICIQSLAKSASSLKTTFLSSGPTAKALALKFI